MDRSWLIDFSDLPELHMGQAERNHFGYYCCTCGYRMSYFTAHHAFIAYRCRNQDCKDNYLNSENETKLNQRFDM